MKYSINVLFLSISLRLSSSNSFAESSLTFKRAWIAEAPPVSKVLAAYMEITNGSDKTVIIDSMKSKDFKKIEFHRTIQENDKARMQHQKSLSIPASGMLKLEPGSYHLMLFNPVRTMSAGDSATFTVSTADNQQYEISVTVKKSNDSHQHHHHH